jgi:hypothetical protein
MDIGMLWFDDDTKNPLTDRIKRGAEFYKDKYGRWPNSVHVNPRMLAGDAELVNYAGIRVLPNKTILNGHFWYGVSHHAAASPTGTDGAAGGGEGSEGEKR